MVLISDASSRGALAVSSCCSSSSSSSSNSSSSSDGNGGIDPLRRRTLDIVRSAWAASDPASLYYDGVRLGKAGRYGGRY